MTQKSSGGGVIGRGGRRAAIVAGEPTAREMQVLALLWENWTQTKIARELGVTRSRVGQCMKTLAARGLLAQVEGGGFALPITGSGRPYYQGGAVETIREGVGTMTGPVERFD